MTTDSIDTSHLQSIYDAALAADNDKSFFLGIYEYVKAIEGLPILPSLQKALNAAQKKDNQELDGIKKEMASLVDKAIKLLSNRKGLSPEVQTALKAVVQVRHGQVVVNGDKEGIRYANANLSSLCCMLRKGPQQEGLHKELGIEFYPDSDTPITSKAGKLVSRFNEAQESLTTIRETRAWYAWEKLEDFERTLEGNKALKAEFDKKPDIGEALVLVKSKEELQAILSGRKTQRLLFGTSDYRNYLGTFHRYLIDFCNKEMEDSPSKEGKTYSKIIANDDFIVRIGDVRFSMKLRTQKARLLKELFRNRGKKAHYDNVISKLDTLMKVGATPKDKERCYNLCRGLENTFAKKGITDFLEYDYNGVAVNKAYRLVKW